MPAEINYKNKYMELRSKYMSDLDMAFRLGFEQGQQQAQQDQMMQQQQQAQEVQMAAAQGQAQGGFGGEQPGQPGDPEATQAGAEGAPSAAPEAGGSELDQHISKLEQAIAKSEDAELKKSLHDLKELRKKEALNAAIRKNDGAIKAIARALHKPAFKMSQQASHNLSANAKQAVSLQHKIVNDVMAKMEAEERRANMDIAKLLAAEGATKKE